MKPVIQQETPQKAPATLSLTRRTYNGAKEFAEKLRPYKTLLNVLFCLSICVYVGMVYSLTQVAIVLVVYILAALFAALLPFLEDIPWLLAACVVWVIMSVTSLLDLGLHTSSLREQENRIVFWVLLTNVLVGVVTFIVLSGIK